MRRASTLWGPLLLITFFYAFAIGLATWVVELVPALSDYLPIGGVASMHAPDATTAALQGAPTPAQLHPVSAIKLAAAIVCVIFLMVPVSWVYFVTTRDRDVDRSFAQTIIVLPVIVAGIAMIVNGNLALAFSLAGVVAAVRFRFTLNDPAQALYIFIAIAVGLGAGINAVGVAAVVSIAFVYLTLALWKLDYGVDLNTRFFSFLTGRGRGDKDL
jgi:Domain of unknown function (DUF4956)